MSTSPSSVAPNTSSVLPCAWARLTLASCHCTLLPLRRSAPSVAVRTVGTMVPSISATKVCCGATASGRPWGKPPLVWWKSLGVVQRDLPDGALAHDDAVVLDKLVHRLGEGPQSDAKSVTARCNRREQPLAFTPALRTNGRSLLLPCRYCGSVTQMSPKVVCQQSFFYPHGALDRLVALPAPRREPGARPTLAWPLAPGGVIPQSSAARQRQHASDPRRHPARPTEAIRCRICGCSFNPRCNLLITDAFSSHRAYLLMLPSAEHCGTHQF